MRTVWAVAVMATIMLAAEVRADTVYLKDGQSVWGTEVIEEGDVLVVVRPGESIRIPRNNVNRVERSRVSIPRYYDPPSVKSAVSGKESPPPPAAPPPAAAAPPTAGPPPAPESGAVKPPAAQPPTVSGPAPPTPTLLPPPPPPSTVYPR